MTRYRTDLRGGAFRSVFAFCAIHWRRQWLRCTALAFSFLLATLADVLTPLFAGQLVDAIASGTPGDPATRTAALSAFVTLIALAAGALVLRHTSFMGIITLTLRMMTDIGAGAFSRVQQLSTDWHANSFAGSTVRKVTRGMWALDVLNDTILMALIPSLTMLIGTTILLGIYWPVMGLIVAAFSVLHVCLTVGLTLFVVAPAATLSNAWDTRVGGALADAVSCNAVVKAFGAEVREEERLRGVLGKWHGRTRRTWTLGTWSGTTQGAAIVLMRAAIIGAALWLWADGQATAGDVTFMLTSFFLLQGYLRDIGTHVRNVQRSVNDMEELVELQGEPLGVADRPGAAPLVIRDGGIRFDDVTFHYGSHAAPLYKDFTVEIRPGERVGLVGHSGSGKTTFVKLIQRLYDVSGGHILIDGQDIAAATQASLRQQVAIVQQEPILFHRSLAENIAYARPGAAQAEVEKAARLANAHDFIEALPKGYATLVGERGVKLSGGERQRVAIARAFLADSPILILDEATSSLDSESEHLIQQAMTRLMQGRTTLVIAHRLSTVKALDRLLVFDRGRIAEEGRHDELVRREGGIYRGLFERQALELTKGMEA